MSHRPGKRGPWRRPLAARFWPKVDIRDDHECWLWMGAMGSVGYGKMMVEPGFITEAHRAAYILVHGSIPAGLYILHSCDNKRCVNPNHLRAGTPVDNMRDMHQRGRDNNHWRKQTHCSNGHEFSPENTYQYTYKRACKTCINARAARYAAERKKSEASISEECQ